VSEAIGQAFRACRTVTRRASKCTDTDGRKIQDCRQMRGESRGEAANENDAVWAAEADQKVGKKC
jgi:hypothetical protein